MKKLLIITALFGFTAVGFESCSEGASSSEQTVESYACPMKCEGDKTHSEKGNCSVCGMELTAVE